MQSHKPPVDWFVFLVGISIAFRIVFFIYFVLVKGDVYSADSYLYIDLAKNLVDHFEFARNAHAPFTPEVFRTPGYPAFLAVIQVLGMHNLYWTVFWQEIIYLACVLMFFYYGRTLFSRNTLRICVLFMLLEPGGLAYPKEILTEDLFLPWITSGLLAIGYYCRFFKVRFLILAGLLLGIGAMVKPGIAYLIVVITGVLLIAEINKQRSGWHAGVFILTFALSLSPWLARNYYHFDKLFLTGQQSNILAKYHAPIVLGAAKGWSHTAALEYVDKKIADAEQHEQTRLNRPLSPVEKFELEQKMALQVLKNYPKDYLTLWLYGIVKSMASGHLLEIYTELHVPIDHLSFHKARGEVIFNKLINFIQDTDLLYVTEVILRIVITGFALIGAMRIVISKDYFLWIIMLANFYLISTPGPIGYARYRFPIEVFWLLQASVGYLWCVAAIKLMQNKDYSERRTTT